MAEEGEKPGGAASLEGMRDWLLTLEKRVTELEREQGLARRRRRRGFWAFVILLVLYALVLNLEMIAFD